MIPEEIQQLKPGIVMDTLVANKVMGWGTDHEWSFYVPEKDRFVPSQFHQFSVDISAAWEVLEHLKSKGAEINVGFYEKWDCDIDYPIGCNWREVGETAPEAICKAALLAVLGEGEA